jgi:peroxiredoxin
MGSFGKFTLSGLILLTIVGSASAQTVKLPLFPQPAPYFVLPTWDGHVVKHSSLKGQVILLEFFQTWCPDCQKAAPRLEMLYQKYKDQGFTVVGISHDSDQAKAVEPFVKKYNLSYPVCLGDLSIAINYLQITPQKPSFRIPYLVFIDRKGMIVGRYEEGTHPEATNPVFIEEEIRRLLREPRP